MVCMVCSWFWLFRLIFYVQISEWNLAQYALNAYHHLSLVLTVYYNFIFVSLHDFVSFSPILLRTWTLRRPSSSFWPFPRPRIGRLVVRHVVEVVPAGCGSTHPLDRSTHRVLLEDALWAPRLGVFLNVCSGSRGEVFYFSGVLGHGIQWIKCYSPYPGGQEWIILDSGLWFMGNEVDVVNLAFEIWRISIIIQYLKRCWLLGPAFLDVSKCSK